MNSDLPADWDPPTPLHRELVRDAKTGELGYFVRRSGKAMVRLDRANQDIVKRYIESEWLPEVTQRPLSKEHAARAAFEADKILCRALNMPGHAMLRWETMDEAKRVLWRTTGPTTPAARVALFKAVTGALEPFTRMP